MYQIYILQLKAILKIATHLLMMHSIIVNNHFQLFWFDQQKFNHRNRF